MLISDQYNKLAHQRKKVDFDAIVDLLALIHINKRKAKAATNRMTEYWKNLALIHLTCIQQRKGCDTH